MPYIVTPIGPSGMRYESRRFAVLNDDELATAEREHAAARFTLATEVVAFGALADDLHLDTNEMTCGEVVAAWNDR